MLDPKAEEPRRSRTSQRQSQLTSALLEPTSEEEPRRSRMSQRRSSAREPIIDSVVVTEGPHKSVQCIVSPPLRDHRKALITGLLSDLEENLNYPRNEDVTVRTIERYLRLDTPLRDRAIHTILHIVRDGSLSNIQVVKKLRHFLQDKVNLWEGLSVYIMKTKEPNVEKRRRKSSASGTDVSSYSGGSSTSTSLLEHNDATREKGRRGSAKSDRSRNSSYAPAPDDCIDKNLSRYVEEPEDNAGDPDEMEVGADESNLKGPREESKKSPRSDEEPLPELGDTDPLVSESASTALLKETDINPDVAKVLVSIFQKHSAVTSKFKQVASRIKWGVTAIRALVRAASWMRKTFMTSLFDHDDSDFNLSESRSKSILDAQMSQETYITDQQSVSSKESSSNESVSDIEPDKATTRRSRVSRASIKGKQGDYEVRITPSGKMKYTDSEGREVMALGRLSIANRQYFTEKGTEVVDLASALSNWYEDDNEQYDHLANNFSDDWIGFEEDALTPSRPTSPPRLYNAEDTQTASKQASRTRVIYQENTATTSLDNTGLEKGEIQKKETITRTPRIKTENVTGAPGNETGTLDIKPGVVPETADIETESIPVAAGIKAESLPGTADIEIGSVPGTQDMKTGSGPGTADLHAESLPELPGKNVGGLPGASVMGADSVTGKAGVMAHNVSAASNMSTEAVSSMTKGAVSHISTSGASSKFSNVDSKDEIQSRKWRKFFNGDRSEVISVRRSKRRKYYDANGLELVSIPGACTQWDRMFDEDGNEVRNVFEKEIDFEVYDENGKNVVPLTLATKYGMKVVDAAGNEVVQMTSKSEQLKESDSDSKKNAQKTPETGSGGAIERKPSPKLESELTKGFLQERAQGLIERMHTLEETVDVPSTDSESPVSSSRSGGKQPAPGVFIPVLKQPAPRMPLIPVLKRPPPWAARADCPQGQPVATDPGLAIKIYMQKHGIHQMFEMFLNNLVLERPTQPIDYLITLVQEIGIRQKKKRLVEDFVTMGSKDKLQMTPDISQDKCW